MNVQEALGFGKANALRKVDLAKKLDWYRDDGEPDGRRVEKTIEVLRRAGAVAICSSSLGYWLPLTVEEFEQNLRNRRIRALNQLRNNRGERRAAKLWRERRDAAEIPAMVLFPTLDNAA